MSTNILFLFIIFSIISFVSLK